MHGAYYLNQIAMFFQPMPFRWSLIFSLVCLFLSGCASFTGQMSREKDIVEVSRTIADIRADAEAAKPGACLGLVQAYKKVYEENVSDFGARVDYEYIRQACIVQLSRKIQSFHQQHDYDALEEAEKELVKIDPMNREVLKLHEKAMAAANPMNRLLRDISPTSEFSRISNQYSVHNEDYGVEIQRLLFEKRPAIKGIFDNWAEGKEMTLEEFFSSIAEVAKVNVVLDPDVGFIRINMQVMLRMLSHPDFAQNFISLLSGFSNAYKINFAIFKDSLVGFRGDLPKNRGTPELVNIRVQNAGVQSVSPVLKKVFGDQNFSGVDASKNTIWANLDKVDFLKARYLLRKIDETPGEVEYDVEIYEVQSTVINNIGFRLPTLISFGLGTSGAATLQGSKFRFSDILQDVKSQTTRMIISDPVVQMQANSGSTKIRILSKPSLRVQDGKRSQIFIGSKTPVFNATSSGTGFVSESVNYIDSGIKLDIGAKIRADNMVATDVSLESTLITSNITSPNGATAPQLGSRSAKVQLSLQDGQTATLGGFITSSNSANRSGLPLIGMTELSGIGGYNYGNSTTSELIILITASVGASSLRMPSTAFIPGVAVATPMDFPPGQGDMGGFGAAPAAGGFGGGGFGGGGGGFGGGNTGFR